MSYIGIYYCSQKVPERYENCLQASSSVKGKSLSTPPTERELATSLTANIGRDQMNPGIRILPLPSANGIPGRRMNG